MNAQIQALPRCSTEFIFVEPATLQSHSSRRVQWSFSVTPRYVFTLCRALVVYEYVDIMRCTPVVKRHQSHIRVDITLPANQVDTILSCVMTAVDCAEIGRAKLLISRLSGSH